MNLTDNEIIKALECCNEKARGCEECPMIERDGSCIKFLTREALNLINRQRAEIERLQNMLAAECQHSIEFRNNTIKEFAERLKKDSHLKYTTGEPFVREVDNLVKEMSADK